LLPSLWDALRITMMMGRMPKSDAQRAAAE
jgi:hypothetical protein